MEKTKKIGLICSPGGHLVEVLQLLEAFEGYPIFFLTYKEKATLNRKNTYWIMNFARNPLYLIVGMLKILLIFLKEKPKVLFSTGAEIAIPSFYIGKFLFRTKLIYLECSAQVYSPSLTGRYVYPITDLFLVQWEPLLRQYGPKARYVGGLI
jgi:UDP-N-acetylglucosamine:LPS N-acetylglucosamine transferase